MATLIGNLKGPAGADGADGDGGDGATFVSAGKEITVTGTGSSADPYVVGQVDPYATAALLTIPKGTYSDAAFALTLRLSDYITKPGLYSIGVGGFYGPFAVGMTISGGGLNTPGSYGASVVNSTNWKAGVVVLQGVIYQTAFITQDNLTSGGTIGLYIIPPVGQANVTLSQDLNPFLAAIRLGGNKATS